MVEGVRPRGIAPTNGVGARAIEALENAEREGRGGGRDGEVWGRWGTKGIEGWGKLNVLQNVVEGRQAGGQGPEGPCAERHENGIKTSFTLRIESKWEYLREGGGRRERQRLLEALRAKQVTPTHLLVSVDLLSVA